MFDLRLNDIREWLMSNRAEFLKLKSLEFPPFDNALLSMYGHLEQFIEYYKYKHKCDQALLELVPLINADFGELPNWTRQYEALGSQDLLMFEVYYMDWNDHDNDNKIKIHEGLYTERRPFINIICFCKVFQHLYWNNCIHENLPTAKEESAIKAELKIILDNFYFISSKN